MAMKANEVAQTFADAFNKGDLDTVASYLSEDFQFLGPVPEPLSKDEWLDLTRIFHTAFPDIKYNMRVVSVDGNVVKTSTQLRGTHTGDLDMSAMGMGVIPATGKSFSNPKEYGVGTFENGKIISIQIESGEGSGLMGVLTQLGIQVPAR
jgi:predicted ester cyclase